MPASILSPLSLFNNESRNIDLSHKQMDNNDIRYIIAFVNKLSHIDSINLADNKFSIAALDTLINELKILCLIREFDISNNGLTDSSIPIFHYASPFSALITLRLCNSQINENTLTRFCFLKSLSIQNLYLDNNEIGNSGLLFLLSILKENQSLRLLSLRNNNITDDGFVLLCHYLMNMKLHSTSLQSIDLSDNSIINHNTINLIHSINMSYQHECIHVTMPSSLTSSSLSISSLLQSKPYKDLCIILQLLEILLEISGYHPHHVRIPVEFLFNPLLTNHQQPSVLANRIENICTALNKEDSSNDNLLTLLTLNMSIIQDYLSYSSSILMTISSSHSISPVPSLQSSPQLAAKSLSDSPTAISFPYHIKKEIQLTSGRVLRSGTVKIALIHLLECIVSSSSLSCISTLIALNMNATLLNLFEAHPWSSILHFELTSYFKCILSTYNLPLLFDLIANAGFISFIVNELKNKEKRQKQGYSGHLEQLAIDLDKIYRENGLIGIGYYNEVKKNTNGIQNVTEDDWNEFVNSYVHY